MSYNALKDTWSLNELISHYVQEEERLQPEHKESAHITSSYQHKRKHEATVVTPSQQKKTKKQNVLTCFFCKKTGHVKKDCVKYFAWRAKKGMILAFVCSEVNLSFAPMDTWWVDSGATTHISVTIQGCLWS